MHFTRRMEAVPRDFIREIIARDLAEGRCKRVHTRFPPEPNGYLHIGHAKSICLNFGIAREFGGVCNLRMDDTNPTKEDPEYVKAIIQDVKWLIAGWADHCLGFKPKGKTPETINVNGSIDYYLPPVIPSSDSEEELEPFFASDYFEQLYEFAVRLIKKGKAYVCDHTPEEVDQMRGAPDKPGIESKYRNRSIQENLDLFRRMRDGEFPDGSRTLRAKIDMSSPNIWLRDPVLYRIRHAEHHHTGNKWCIYPTYDFAHCLSDYIEGITHSICTMEFEVHRPLYDWILENLDLPRPLPHQYEFARLNLSYTVLSKRKLLLLVKEGVVSGWDDPRMPTISGLRRRGVTPDAIRAFAYQIGVTKYEGLTDIALFEHIIRQDLNKRALRRLAVLRPVKLVITNYPADKCEEVEAVNNPEDPNAGTRKIPFCRELYIDEEDVMENPLPNYYRLYPGNEVRLKYAYIVRCNEIIKDQNGRIVEVRCTADLGSRSGGPTASRKVKATIHWVSARHAIDAEVRLYDRLFTVPEPDTMPDLLQCINPNSLQVVKAKCEPSLKNAHFDERYQFERLGYFTLDPDTSSTSLVFNRTITLKDAWEKQRKRIIQK